MTQQERNPQKKEDNLKEMEDNLKKTNIETT